MIYLDHAASSPLRPEAREAIARWADAGNPSSSHSEGRRARAEIDRCREIVADALDVAFGEVIFTSGGTEAVQSAILGAALAATSDRKRVLLSATEHECALATIPILERLGFRPELAPVDGTGRMIPPETADGVFLIVAMGLNNELGTVNPLDRLHGFREEGVLVMTDHVQTFGKLPCRVPDFTAVAAHKIGGPKGAGALVVRAGTPWTPWIAGFQERERRGGTENLAAISGFAAAIGLPAGSPGLGRRLRAGLVGLGAMPTVEPDYEGIVHVRFPGRRAETLLVALDRAGICASAGAACASGAVEPSHVLRAMGLPEEAAWEGIRFSTGWSTTEAEIERALAKIARVVSS